MTPQSNQDKSLNNTEKDFHLCINFNQTFDWFDREFISILTPASQDFLNTNIEFSLFALSDCPSIIWKGNDYFVTQAEIIPDCAIFIKMSDTAAQIILDKTFGTRKNLKGELQLKNLTELEAMILTAYNEFLFRSLNNIFLDKKEIMSIQPSDYLKKKLVHLTFCVFLDHHEPSGKIIFSIPHYIIKEPVLVAASEEKLDVTQFNKCSIYLDIFVGRTKITLRELKNIEPDDIVLLDNSDIYSMFIKDKEEIKFNVNPDPTIVIDIDEDMDERGMQSMSDTNSAIKNIWDNIQVDVSAEFQKVKMTLGELRQITEGLVIDVAPIVRNEIYLLVERRRVAVGEIVIIGDRYGIKITKVFPESQDAPGIIEEEIQSSQVNKIPQQAVNSVPVQPVKHQHDNEEEQNYDEYDESADESDFDYNDFEIDEEEGV